MTKQKTIFLVFLALLFSAFAVHARASMDPFADPRPSYEFDWTFSTGEASLGASGQWYSTSLNPHVGQSAGDGTAYNDKHSSCYWTSISGTLSGFSVSNSIGDWIDAIGTGQAAIRYTIREDYSPYVDNSDVVELAGSGIETIVKHGVGVTDSLGLNQGNDITALEWKVDFDDENLNFQHYFAVQGAGPPAGTYDPNVYVGKNMDDEAAYMTWGARAQLDTSDNLYRIDRSVKYWDGTGNGYVAHTSYYITPNPGGDESLGNPTFDGTNWFLPVTVSGTTYSQRMDLPYDEANYPASSGAVVQWYDDYALYLAGAIPNPGGYGVSGRYVLERDEFLYTGLGTGWAHHADVCYEARTYNPIRNPDGPESPYEWVYDGSGDMYNPTDGSGLPGDTEYERAFKLIGVHPAFPNDDTVFECEYPNDRYLWNNQAEGVVGRGLLVDSWRLAGLMLGQEFWNDDPDYFWSGEMGAVAERTWAVEFMDISWYERLPVWTWDSVASEWVLPDTYDLYNPGVMDRLHIWDWVNDYTDTPVAGYEALNDFMCYVFDIDALVVEDADGDGEFDIGDDYILFSVVDDGLYHLYAAWGRNSSYGGYDVSTPFAGQYFDGDTIFMYDGTSVTTYFDAEEGIFFGQVSSAGDDSPLWGGVVYYDIDALDIGIIPEPSTIFLIIGSSGLAVLAGIMRRKLR